LALTRDFRFLRPFSRTEGFMPGMPVTGKPFAMGGIDVFNVRRPPA